MKEWLTFKELADMLGTSERKISESVKTLRRVGLVETTPDPRDERYTLVKASGIPAIKKALNLGSDIASA
jgi:DNA-binding MarR family transcriptional regulator